MFMLVPLNLNLSTFFFITSLFCKNKKRTTYQVFACRRHVFLGTLNSKFLIYYHYYFIVPLLSFALFYAMKKTASLIGLASLLRLSLPCPNDGLHNEVKIQCTKGDNLLICFLCFCHSCFS